MTTGIPEDTAFLMVGQRRPVRVGDRDAVDVAVDRVSDQGGLLGRVRVRGVLEGDVVLGRCGQGAVPDESQKVSPGAACVIIATV